MMSVTAPFYPPLLPSKLGEGEAFFSWRLTHDLCLFIRGGCLFRGRSHTKESGVYLKCVEWRDSRIIFLRLFDTFGHSSCIHILAVCEDNLRRL